MRVETAVGCDGTPIEFLLGIKKEDKPMYSALDCEIERLFNSILASGNYPMAWRIAILVPLAKAGEIDHMDTNNYRGNGHSTT